MRDLNPNTKLETVAQSLNRGFLRDLQEAKRACRAAKRSGGVANCFFTQRRRKLEDKLRATDLW